MADLTTLYAQAPALVEAGERVLSTDEMTGIQALERKHPTRLMEPGQVERREFEYIRRGTLTLIANFDGARGTVVQYFGSEVPQACEFHLCRGFASPCVRFCSVFQCHNSQTF
jgi:hypothetical protein